MQTVFSFLYLTAFLFLSGGHFGIDRLGRRHKVADERKVNINPLCGLDASLAVALMYHDLIDQLIQHCRSQILEILILVDQRHEPLCFTGAVGITFDRRRKFADLLFKSRTFALILVTKHLIPLVRQFPKDIVLIDLAEKCFQFFRSALALAKPFPLDFHVLCLLTAQGVLNRLDELRVIYLDIIMDGLERLADSLQQIISVDPVAGLAFLSRIVAAGELIDSFAVIRSMAIKLPAASGAIDKLCQRMCQTPAVRPSGHVTSDLLDQIDSCVSSKITQRSLST